MALRLCVLLLKLSFQTVSQSFSALGLWVLSSAIYSINGRPR